MKLILFFIFDINKNMLNKLQKRLAYYKHLQQIQQLNERQQKKMDLYVEQLRQLKTESKTFNKDMFKAYLERNNEMGKQRNKMRINYEIGNLKFHTQHEANEYFQTYLKEHDAADIDDNVVALVKRHPDFEEGSKIEIRPNETFPQWKNFVIVKPSGEVNHLSVKTCLRGKYDKAHVKKVFRMLIIPQMEEFREAHHAETCPCCNQAAEKFDVDHITPFKTILNNFIEQNQLDLNEVKTVQRKSLPDLADEELKNKWIQFHRENAHYQLLCQKCNRKKGCSE